MASPQNRIVHYVLTNAGGCRPFLVTRVWNEELVNGTLFIDGTNDYENVPYWSSPQKNYKLAVPAELLIWRTSIKYDKDKNVHTWHWPEIEGVDPNE